MKTLKRHAGILLMLTLLVGFTSCEDDEDIFDEVVGRTWVGYLGFHDGRYDLESGIYLSSDGFGEDELRYYDTHTLYDTFRIQWEISGGSIFINYGNRAAPRELRDVYVRKGRLSAALFVDGIYVEDVELIMN